MGAQSGRLWAIHEVTSREIRRIPQDGKTVTDIFGANTFNAATMQQKLPASVYASLQDTIRRGARLDPRIAAEVAHAVKEWALEKGVSHFCHWFQPQTGLTAEKHDSFLTLDEGVALERFSGAQLIQSEPDASSFPSGGMRTTFEARGYTAWDPSSPIFIVEGPSGKTLCIPSAFISYHGDALDKKTPLLRSTEALSERALEVLRLFGNDRAVRVWPTVGPEQEYFLIDRAFQALRPDLIATGRTLIGALPPKGQQLDDHYFGSIKERILAFMQESEMELFKLGVPIKTRHNEVAPSQYESTTIFNEASIAADHNQLVMETMRRVAGRHNLVCLLHEKPFDGVNGSGKHCNWSMMDTDGDNLLEPGETPERNLQFLVFLLAVLKGVHKRAGLLRAGISNAGNDHRLGANEAPPAIISVFLGEQLTRVLDSIEAGETPGASSNGKLDTRTRLLPEISRDNTDRNRTSPFAFTGNKFEFRAVPSSVSIAPPVAYLNAAVAEALEELIAAIRSRLDDGKELPEAVIEVIREAVIATKAVRFEGNNYADEWVAEAERRGLPNLRTAPEGLAELVKPDTKAFLARLNVLSEAESEARYNVRLERYINDIEIEADALQGLVSSHVMPAAYRQQAMLRSAGGAHGAGAADCLDAGIGELIQRTNALHEAVERAQGAADHAAQAKLLADQVRPAMRSVREACDRIESSVADEFWTLPKYAEMLFLV